MPHDILKEMLACLFMYLGDVRLPELILELNKPFLCLLMDQAQQFASRAYEQLDEQLRDHDTKSPSSVKILNQIIERHSLTTHMKGVSNALRLLTAETLNFSPVEFIAASKLVSCSGFRSLAKQSICGSLRHLLNLRRPHKMEPHCRYELVRQYLGERARGLNS